MPRAAAAEDRTRTFSARTRSDFAYSATSQNYLNIFDVRFGRIRFTRRTNRGVARYLGMRVHAVNVVSALIQRVWRGTRLNRRGGRSAGDAGRSGGRPQSETSARSHNASTIALMRAPSRAARSWAGSCEPQRHAVPVRLNWSLRLHPLGQPMRTHTAQAHLPVLRKKIGAAEFNRTAPRLTEPSGTESPRRSV